MNQPPTPRVLQVIRLGKRAERTLTASDQFRVIALFTRSMYLADDAGELVCVLTETLENGPLHLLVRGWPDGGGGLVRDGDRFARDGRRLVSPALTLDFSEASVWTPQPYPSFNRTIASAGLERLLRSAAEMAPDGTIAASLLFSRAGPTDPLDAALVRKVHSGLRDLEFFLGTDGASGGEPVATDLLGLGPGLTPSGDDILAGIFLGSRAVGALPVVEKLSNVLRDRVPDATNAISAAHLYAAMDGEANAVFHDILGKTLTGGDGLEQTVERLHGIGHSSGWDGLLGIIWALRRCIAAE